MEIGELIQRDGARVVRVGFGEGSERLPLASAPADVAPGSFVAFARDEGAARVGRVLARAGTALADVYDIAVRAGLALGFSADLMAEVDAIVAAPGIDDPELIDLEKLPFVTIDYQQSKDLDQAVHVERRAGGYRVRYALADAAYYVRPGMALFAEALARGASYYLPGLTVPMLPVELSEGIVSLNEGVARRALVFVIDLDDRGVVVASELLRARVRSRSKLTYAGVQAHADDPSGSPLAGQPFSESLALLATVGELRIALAEERDVVDYDRVSLRLDIADDDALVLQGEQRNRAQRWNEQISLVTNIEGARFLTGQTDGGSGATGLFRVHPPPPADELETLASSIDELVEALELDPDWRWRRSGPDSESLADYVERLPDDGPGWRLACALQRQAMLINRPSVYSLEPALHYGIGAAAYSRFSSPMRELVGIVTEQMAYHQLAGEPIADSGLDRGLLEAAVEAGNRSKRLQKRVTREANKLAIDQLFAGQLEQPADGRPVYRATVLGLSDSKIYLQLDDPPIELKLYVDDQAELFAAPLALRNRFTLTAGELVLRVGDEIRVRAHAYVAARDRWVMQIEV